MHVVRGQLIAEMSDEQLIWLFCQIEAELPADCDCAFGVADAIRAGELELITRELENR